MKKCICFLLLSTCLLTSWACSCIGIHPINLASLNADQVVVAKIHPQRPYTNALELKVHEVLKGNRDLAGNSILLWQDYLDCSSMPAIDTSHEFIIAFDQIKDADLAGYLGQSRELQSLPDSASYKQAMQEIKNRPNFVLLGCSDSYVKLEDRMRIEIARKYKKKKKRIIIRTKKRRFKKMEFIAYLRKLEKI